MTSASQVLAALGDPVIAVDRDGRVAVWTPAAERLLRFTAEEVVGHELPDVGIRLEALMAGRERRLTLRRRDGDTLPAIVTATPLLGPEDERTGLVLVVKDLTTWIGGPAKDGSGSAAEERLGAAFRGLVEATGADVERAGRLEPLAQCLAEQGRRLLPGVSCLVAIVPSTRQEVFCCLAGAGPVADGLVGRSLSRDGTMLGEALADNNVVECADLKREHPSDDVFLRRGVRTMRAVPMATQQPLPDGRRTLGAIAFFRTEARPFTQAERVLLDDFGTLAGYSLQRAELRAATERSNARLQLAVQVALDLAQSLDQVEVVRRLVRRAAVATRADRCALLRVEGGEDGEMVTVDAYDVSARKGFVGYGRPVAAQELVREAVVSRTPVLAGRQDLSGMPGALREALADVRHTIAVPLIYMGDVVAVLVLSRRRDQPFGSEDLDTLMQLAGPAALAIRNSFLYSQTEEASRIKTDFLDMAAHELRTPLTVISGYLAILREGSFGPTPPKWTDPLRILDGKAAELRRLVDDLLLAARLDTGQLETVLRPVDLREMAEQAAHDVGDVPEVGLPADPVMVRGDRDQLSRLIDQLVNNALSYSRSGEDPWARLEVEACPEQGDARLRVIDRGRGLLAGSEEQIFERFSRIECPEHPAVPGTGLGLYIARELATRHNGRLELEWTNAGAGSCFALYLPLLEGVTPSS